jgi:hypothetical protein
MKLAMITADLTTLAILVGAAINLIPAAAGLLAVVYYGFLIYDRIKYGPQLFHIHKDMKDG